MKSLLNKFIHKVKIAFFGFRQLILASHKETFILITIVCVQAFIPSCSLLIIQKVTNWIASYAIEKPYFPIDLAILWGVLLLLEVALSPLAGVTRIHLNERVIAHCNLLLMEKANSIQGLTPFEDPKLHDEIQFLKSESVRRPLNFVFLITGVIKDLFGITSIFLVLSQFGCLIPLIVILSSIPHAFSTYWLQKQSWDQMLLRSPESRRMAWLASQTLDEQASKEIRLFGFGNFLVQQYKLLARSLHDSFSAKRWKKSWQSICLSAITVIGNVIVFILVINNAIQGNFTAGAAIMTLQALVMTQMLLDNFIQDIGLIVPTLLFFDKLKKFLSSDFDHLLKKGKRRVEKSFLKEGICFDDVSFSYPDGRKVLSKVSFSIPAGSKIAIVGENGAGKSTLVKLLSRLYDPTEGRILIDGVDLAEMDIEMWRRSLSIVFQDFGKYHLSAKDNIGISSPSPHFTDIANAAKKGGFDSVAARLPEGFNSLLGKEFGGTSLSGGEWQKLAMSRAFLRDADVLILDEPTAALDPKSEHEVFETFAKNTNNKTTFFITHRLGSIRMADRILVLKNGELIEEGNHNELMDKAGTYAYLFSLQANRYS